MGELSQTKAAKLLLSHKQHARYVAALICTAVLVVFGVSFALRRTGITLAREDATLECHYDGNGAHTHNEDCYDAEGNLVCPLQERELHVHDDSCYAEEKTLVCGQEETSGHTHDESCYDADGNLVCGQEESAGHTHTDDCYETTRVLVCGKEEVTEEHVHGPGCFTDETETSDEEQVSAQDQVLTADLRETDEYGVEHVVVAASVKAPAGVLPEGVTLSLARLSETDEQEALAKVEAALQEEYESDTTIKQILIVSPELADAQEVDVIPATDVQVRFTTTLVRDARATNPDNIVLVRLPDTDDPATDEAAIVRDVSLVNGDEHDDSTGNEDTLQFSTDEKLTPYALIELEEATESEQTPEVPSASEEPAAGDGMAGEEGTAVPDPELESEEPSVDATTEIGASAAYELKQTLTASDGRTYEVTVALTADAGIPEDAELVVREITERDSAFNAAYDKATQAATAEHEEATVTNVRLFDISLMKDGTELEPLAPVEVSIVLASGINGNEATSVLHFTNDEVESLDANVAPIGEEVATSTAASEAEVGAGAEISFNTERFSIFAVVEMHIEKDILASDGQAYHIEVSYTADAGVPEGAELEVREILQETEASDEATEYETYVAKTQEALGLETAAFPYARFFDIKIVDDHGEKVTIAAPVDVTIELADKSTTEEAAASTQVVHFADGSDTGDVVTEAATEGNTVAFPAEGFSAYAIVDGPPPIPLGWHKITSIDDLIAHASDDLYLGHTSGYYFTSGITNISSTRTGITKTKPAQVAPPSAAVPYHFEQVVGTSDQFYVYCSDGGAKKYIVQSANSLNLTTSKDGASVFTIEPGKANEFRAKGSGNYYWNMQGGANGASFAAYEGATDVNAQFNFWYRDPVEDDPYGLDGVSYGLMNWNGGAAGKAMMGEASEGSLEAKALTLMTTSNDSKHLFVPNDAEILMWTFHWLNNDIYEVTTVVDGSTKYLRIGSDGLSLVSEPDESCHIQVVPGSGTHAGEVFLKSGNTTLTYSGSLDEGFSVGGSAGSEWLHFVEIAPDPTSEYHMTYSAKKVSVSSEEVTDKSQVIVYTRSWNDREKRYDFFAISSDGRLVPVTENGDSIEWQSGQLNTLLWDFTEHYWEGTTTPNYYYDLYNERSQRYLAPQITNGQILAPEPIGINLNGRRDGQYYSTILAWDANNYSYAGLKVENGSIVACPKSEAMDFYFAIMEPLNIDDDVHTVETVDNGQYGITMKIIDLDNDQTINGDMNKFLGSNAGGAVTTLVQGLLTTDLKENGYPTATKEGGESLAVLYSDEYGELREVNHLFIESTYYASGYFEYDSTQNFATLQDDNNFKVYKELGTHDASKRPTLQHGQFFPFNDLEAGTFASLNSQNIYTINGSVQLPNSDPRKYENLYNIENRGKKTDYYFGVELEASFTQTANGLDAWDHDIIFEFTGDDDFWLYVDNELVIDLGGIHSAVPGSVNFSTGEVNVNGTHTTLRQLFYDNYVGRGHTPAQAEAYVNERFEQNERGEWVFKDYTNHTMRIFYMERGAGASNLQMRFNLAAVKKGTVQLSKELSGVDDTESIMTEFPYQIWYRKSDEPGAREYRLTNATTPPEPDYTEDFVFYKDSVKPVKFEKELTIDGYTYSDVFFLKPGEAADITFPDGMKSYRIVECGVDAEVFRSVKVNDASVSPTTPPGGDPTSAYKDFGIGYATTDARAKVNYENEVDPTALRTLTVRKRLFAEDGVTEITPEEDSTFFNFRLYLGSEYDPEPTEVNMHTYHVKNPDGYYCRWDSASQMFVVIGEGISDYSQLTDEQKVAASFSTSVYGQITNIPTSYIVEVRDVLAGTRYEVEERIANIPDGYSLQKYVWYENYTPSSQGKNKGTTPFVETIVKNKDPRIDVCNLKGWGLRVNKTWADADYMTERDATYFAVYTWTTPGGDETLVPGTVRQMPYAAKPQSLYWYFLPLPVDVPFVQYEIREVMLSGGTPIVDSDGVVTNANQLTITPISQGGQLELQGTQKGEGERSSFEYTVLYTKGSIPDDSNVRVDTVKNNRPGVELRKTDWSGNPLEGATFTLKRGDEEIGTFTSNEEGYITDAFLSDDVNYTLTETSAPQGWYGLQKPLTLKLSSGVFTVTGDVDPIWYIVDASNDAPMLTIKDKPYAFQAVKKDGDTDTVMEGVEFALHRLIKVGDVTKYDDNPMPGYESLVTDADGLIPKIDNTLPAGTYWLKEKTPTGYKELPGFIRFTVSALGDIELIGTTQEPIRDGVTLERTGEDPDPLISYDITIENFRMMDITLKKVDEARRDLVGSKFELCKYNGSTWEAVEEIDLTQSAMKTIKDLGPGRYCLTETKAPKGYVILTNKVYFKIDFEASKRVILTNQAGEPATYENASVNGSTITISNTPGVALPHTGGSGTWCFTLFGAVTTFVGVVLLVGKASRSRKGKEGSA